MQGIDPGWAGIGAVIAAVGTFIAGQRHGKAEFITAVSKASEIVINRLQKEIERVDEARLRCEQGHDECREEVLALKSQVGSLMRGDVAVYKPGDLHRVTK